MNKREFYNSIVKIVDESRAAAREKSAEIDAFYEMKKSGKYSAAHIKSHIDPRIKDGEDGLRVIVNEAQAKVARIVDCYASELEARDQVRGDALTDDAKLFSVGVPLAKGEIEALIDRNSDNVTMHKLALRYAKEHDIELKPRYMFPGHYAEIEDVKATARLANSAINNHKSNVTREMFFGEESNFAKAFNVAE